MIVVDFELSTPVLRRSLRDTSEVAVRLDRVYATRGVDTVGRGGADDADGPVGAGIHSRIEIESDSPERLDALEAAFGADPTVEEAAVIASGDRRRRYRVTLSEVGERLSTYPEWVAVDGALVAGSGTADGWELRMHFPTREALTTYRKRCADRDVELELLGLYSDGIDEDAGFGVTEAQEDILQRAIELGYFDIPRSVSLAELGESLDITGQAASERLRRALKTYLTNSMSPERGTPETDPKSEPASDPLTDPAD